MEIFDKDQLKNLYKPANDSNGEDNGQITIIGGSKLFHGAPILSLKAASKFVDMVFFASPDPSVGKVAEAIKGSLSSFVWVPWEDVDGYIEKSDACLIGPGFMRFSSEKTPHTKRHIECDEECQKTREITKRLLSIFPKKKWVIDAGSLQTMDAGWIPEGAIITPNTREFELLFNVKSQKSKVKEMAEKYSCIIVSKGPETIVCSPEDIVIVKGGNPGLTKGGTGDVLAGLTAALFAKNDALVSACSASYIVKKAGDELYEKVGVNYNADDLSEKLPETLRNLQK